MRYKYHEMWSNFVYEVPVIKVMEINFQKKNRVKKQATVDITSWITEKEMPKKYIMKKIKIKKRIRLITKKINIYIKNKTKQNKNKKSNKNNK